MLKLLDINKINHKKGNWLHEIKLIVRKYNLGHLVDDIMISDTEISRDAIKMKLKCAIWNWKFNRYTEKQFSSKTFKRYLDITNYSIGPHSYLFANIDDNHIKKLVLFKVGGSRLNYIKGKIHKNHNLEDLMCDCTMDSIENELHILSKCPKYDHLRQKIFPSIKHINSYSELGIIVTKSTKENIRKLSLLICNIYRLRNKEMVK
jgi:hypothetical protein